MIPNHDPLSGPHDNRGSTISRRPRRITFLTVLPLQNLTKVGQGPSIDRMHQESVLTSILPKGPSTQIVENFWVQMGSYIGSWAGALSTYYLGTWTLRVQPRRCTIVVNASLAKPLKIIHWNVETAFAIVWGFRL